MINLYVTSRAVLAVAALVISTIGIIREIWIWLKN